jgi:SAM-dependent methyltransferase
MAMHIPDEAVTYILFQRTAYLRLPVAVLARLQHILPVSLYNALVNVEARTRSDQIKHLYAEDMRGEYETFRDALPAECAAVLDIGCGVAGIDVLLQQHYADRKLDIFLLDKTQVEQRVFYQFNPAGAFYNSLAVARDLLVANGIDAAHVHLHEATDSNDIAISTSVDLVISLISWGFHYPVETYIQRVYEVLRPGGVVILDVRKQTSGLDMLKDMFAQVDVLLETKKQHRVAAYKE